jgi:uncharacterized protein YegL
VVLVIDTSESMIGTPLDDTKSAALAFVDRLAEGDEIAILDFDSDIVVAQNFTTNHDAARDAINGLEAGGRTALYDANFSAAELANTTESPRRFVIFLTDGNEFGGLSTHLPEEGTQLAADNNIALYTIGLGYDVQQDYLSDMAAQTGGQYYLYPNSATLAELYDFLATYLRTQYIVTVDTSIEPDGADHVVTVSAAGASGTRNYTAIDLYPQVAVSGIPEEAIDAPTTLQVNVTAERLLDAATVSIDGDAIPATQGAFNEDFENGVFDATIIIDPLSFAPGTHTLTVTAGDQQGGVREVESSFTVAEIPPELAVSGLGDDLISEDTLDITVDILSSQLPPSAVEIGVDGQTITTLEDAPFEYTLDVLDIGSGDHTLDLTIILPDGNAYQHSEGFSVDPALFITPSPTPSNTPEPTATPAPEEAAAEATEADQSLGSTATAIVAEATSTAEAIATVEAESQNSTATAVIAGATSTAEAQSLNDTATAVVDNATAIAATDAEVAQAASDTPAPTDVADTDTPEPSDTPAPTATASPEPSETPEEEDTDTPEPSATVSATEEGEPEDVTVSAEDEGDGSSSVLPIVGIVVLLVIVVAGYLFTRRGSNQQSA